MKYIEETGENDHQRTIDEFSGGRIKSEFDDESLNWEGRSPDDEGQTTRNENCDDEKHWIWID